MAPSQGELPPELTEGGLTVNIRKTTMQDLPDVCRIYERARDFMRKSGNPDQWKEEFPTPEIVARDIEADSSYLCISDDKIAAVFYFNVEDEPSYLKIGGQWLNDDPYGVVHRIASSRVIKGAGEFCINWCLDRCHNLRIDTHRDNLPMRYMLDKLGFVHCGRIWLENGDERMAFQKVSK